jgi:hypothetical protein
MGVGADVSQEGLESQSAYTYYSSVVTVVERLYFLSGPYGGEWIEDEEQHTDWSDSSYFLSHSSLKTDTNAPNSISHSRSVGGPVLGTGSDPRSTDPGLPPSQSSAFHRNPSGQSFASCFEANQSLTPEGPRAALSSSHSPPLSPSGRHLKDGRKFFRSADFAFSSPLSVVVEDPSQQQVQGPDQGPRSVLEPTEEEYPVIEYDLKGVKGRGQHGTGAGPGPGPGPVSALSQSLQQTQNQFHNQNPNNLSLHLPYANDTPGSPLLSPYMKPFGASGSSFGPNATLNPSPSWRHRERERDRGAIRGGSVGGISSLIRMQSTGGSMGGAMGHTHSHTGGSTLSAGHTHTVSGGVDVKAMIGEAKRRSDQRLNTDRQYLHRLAFACVRVGPTGFVWLSNISGKVSDQNLNISTKHNNMIGKCPQNL